MSETPAINADLIRQYATSGESGIQNLITLFEALSDQRNRAEFALRVSEHERIKLAQSIQNITKPLARENYPKPAQTPTSASKPTQAPAEGTAPMLDLEF